MFKNISSNWVLLLTTVVSAYLMVPLTLRSLGNSQYGTWLLISSFAGYLGLLALGVPMSAVRFIAHDAASCNYRDMNRTIATCAGLYLLIGLATLLAGGLLLVVLERAYAIPPVLRSAARLSYLIIVIGTSISFFAQLPHGIMAAQHDFVRRNLVSSGGVVVRLVFTVVVLSLDPTLTMLAMSQLVPMVMESAVMWWMITRSHPEVKLDFSLFDWTAMRAIFSFSIFVLILGVGIQLSFQTDNLVIGRLLGIAQIPFYSVANTFMVYAMQFIIGIAAVVMPMATKLQAQGKRDELRKVFFKWSKVALSLTLFGSVYLIVFGPALIGVWIAPSFEKPSGEVLRVLMISAIVFLPVRGVALPVLMGIGKPGKATIAFLVAGLLNLLLSILLARPLGLLGVALGTAIPNVLFSGYLLLICAKEVDFRISEYFTAVLARPVIGAIPIVLVMMWVSRSFVFRTLSSLLCASLLTAILFALVWGTLVYRTDEDINVRGMLVRARKRVYA